MKSVVKEPFIRSLLLRKIEENMHSQKTIDHLLLSFTTVIFYHSHL
jgi:hypothetical protein